MDSANLWLNPAEDGTDVIESNDTNISNDTKRPDPTLLPSPAEPQQQQIQDKNVNGVVGAALNESNNKSLISPPHPRPNIDIILSLKYPAYGAVMLHYFHLMGNKITDNTANEERGVTSESEMAQKALLHFKRISKSTTVRFFNLLSGNLVDGAFEEVDEEAALRSEFTLDFQMLNHSHSFRYCSLLA